MHADLLVKTTAKVAHKERNLRPSSDYVSFSSSKCWGKAALLLYVSVCVRVREWLGKVCVPVEVWISGFLCAFVPACAFRSFTPVCACVCVFVLILEMAAGKESLWCVTEQLIISHSAPHTVETRRGRDWGGWKRSAAVKEEICSPLWPGLNINCAAPPQLKYSL